MFVFLNTDLTSAGKKKLALFNNRCGFRTFCATGKSAQFPYISSLDGSFPFGVNLGLSMEQLC